MASCECCHKWARDYDDYKRILKEHEERGCPCASPSPTLEGRKLIAGQFWDEERQVDTRLDELVKALGMGGTP